MPEICRAQDEDSGLNSSPVILLSQVILIPLQYTQEETTVFIKVSDFINNMYSSKQLYIPMVCVDERSFFLVNGLFYHQFWVKNQPV